MSITVSTSAPFDICIACDGGETDSAFRLDASARHPDFPGMGNGASIHLCEAHALRMWNALGAMLRLAGLINSKYQPSARGKKLL